MTSQAVEDMRGKGWFVPQDIWGKLEKRTLERVLPQYIHKGILVRRHTAESYPFYEYAFADSEEGIEQARIDSTPVTPINSRDVTIDDVVAYVSINEPVILVNVYKHYGLTGIKTDGDRKRIAKLYKYTADLGLIHMEERSYGANKFRVFTMVK